MSRIAYLIPEFPGQTHIFFWRERRHLLEAGLEVRWISTRPPRADSRAHHDWAQQAADQTAYLTPMTAGQKLNCVGTLLKAGPMRLARAITSGLGLDQATFVQRIRALAMLVPAARLKQITQHDGIEHIHAHSAAGAALIAMLCHLLGGPSYSITLHGAIPTYGPGQQAKWTNAAFGITVNRQLRDALTQQVSGIENKVYVAPMGVDVDVFSRESYQPPKPVETWRLVTCGRLHRGKGHADLVKAVKLLREQHQYVSLTILGEGPDRPRLEKLIDELAVADCVSLCGSVSEEQVRQALHSSHLFALASHDEALGVATMEAMAMALPVVVTGVGGVPELVRDGTDGVLVPPNDPQALAAAIRSVLDHPDQARAMGQAGRQRVCEQFHSARSAEAIIEGAGMMKSSAK